VRLRPPRPAPAARAEGTRPPGLLAEKIGGIAFLQLLHPALRVTAQSLALSTLRGLARLALPGSHARQRSGRDAQIVRPSTPEPAPAAAEELKNCGQARAVDCMEDRQGRGLRRPRGLPQDNRRTAGRPRTPAAEPAQGPARPGGPGTRRAVRRPRAGHLVRARRLQAVTSPALNSDACAQRVQVKELCGAEMLRNV